MMQFQVKIPLFLNILTSLRVETSLSEIYWKGLLLYLSEKSEVPFNKAEEVNTGNCIGPNGLCRNWIGLEYLPPYMFFKSK